MNSSPCPLARPLSLLILLSLGLYAQRTRGQAPTGSEVTATSTPTARIITSGTPVVSVLDFGATGNGGHPDDTAAINAAMAACVSKGLRRTMDASFIFLPASTSRPGCPFGRL